MSYTCMDVLWKCQDLDFLAESFSKSCSVQFMKHGNELKDERCPVISVKIDNALVYKNI